MDPAAYNANTTVDVEEDENLHVFDEPVIEDNKLKRSTSSATPFGIDSARKKGRGSVYENAAAATADGMTFLGMSIKEAALIPPDTRFDQCMEILNEMRDDGHLSSTHYFCICDMFLEKEKYQAMFYRMPSDLRLEWLTKQGLLD